MYKVAQVDASVCAGKKCKLCSRFCPEANTLLYNKITDAISVAVDRCKGCGICVNICSDKARRNAIKMVLIADVCDGFEISRNGFP